MISYSIWKADKFDSLKDFSECLQGNRNMPASKSKRRGDLTLKNEIIPMDEVDQFKAKQVIIDEEATEYVLFMVNPQTTIKNQETEQIEVIDSKEYALAYESNGNVVVVFLTSQTNAEKIISRIFSQMIWGVFDAVPFISEDILYWLFYRLREMYDQKISSKEMYLNGIVSYLGRTADSINAVRGVGLRVTALLGTLGMILGEESLRALRPEIEYKSHYLRIEVCVGNYGKVYERAYTGPLKIESSTQGQVGLVILACKYILPSLIKGYNDDMDNAYWSLQVKRSFLKNIGNEMQEKVERELVRISNEIKKADESLDDEVDLDVEFNDIDTDE